LDEPSFFVLKTHYPSRLLRKTQNQRESYLQIQFGVSMEANGNGDFAVRCRLNIKTTMGDEFEAEVIKFYKPSNIVVLQESAGNGL
jgi:hypothetical protein